MTISNAAAASTPAKDPITGLAKSRDTGQRTLGADDFMKILMTQLTAQDPMNPMKDTEFIAQMANFSSLEQMRGLSQSFTAYSNSQQMATAPLYLGCEVTVKDPSSELGEIKGKVESVTVKNGAPALVINGKTYDPKLITNISLPPQPIAPVTPGPIDSSTLSQPTTTN
jgi:flagellar basal-body rod modification protein FlgD